MAGCPTDMGSVVSQLSFSSSWKTLEVPARRLQLNFVWWSWRVQLQQVSFKHHNRCLHILGTGTCIVCEVYSHMIYSTYRQTHTGTHTRKDTDAHTYTIYPFDIFWIFVNVACIASMYVVFLIFASRIFDSSPMLEGSLLPQDNGAKGDLQLLFSDPYKITEASASWLESP